MVLNNGYWLGIRKNYFELMTQGDGGVVCGGKCFFESEKRASNALKMVEFITFYKNITT